MTVFHYRDSLQALETATKYPSIPTYHEATPNGLLKEGTAMDLDGDTIGREKIDGANARIVTTPDQNYLIGSRELFLHSRGDLVANPVLGMVDTLRPLATHLASNAPDGVIRVYFLELYGGRAISRHSRQYTGENSVGFRMFDIADIDLDEPVLRRDLASIAGWRDNGGQVFHTDAELTLAAQRLGVPLAPDVFRLPAAELPRGIEDTLEFLDACLPLTQAAIDPGAAGKPEGIVVRTPDRDRIAKMRFDQYVRTYNAGRVR